MQTAAGESRSNLDISKEFGFNPDIHLRDEVHTTADGGALYASILYKEIIQNGHSLRSPVDNKTICHSDRGNPLHVHPSLDMISLGDLTSSSFSIQLSIDGSFDMSVLALDQSVGPWSPVVGVAANGKHHSFFSMWDTWCSLY